MTDVLLNRGERKLSDSNEKPEERRWFTIGDEMQYLTYEEMVEVIGPDNDEEANEIWNEVGVLQSDCERCKDCLREGTMVSNGRKYMAKLINSDDRLWTIDKVKRVAEVIDMLCGDEGCGWRCQFTSDEPCEALQFIIGSMLWNANDKHGNIQPFVNEHNIMRDMIYDHVVATYA